MILLAVTDTVWSRLAVFAFALGLGIYLIRTGLQNIQTQSAEETGKARWVHTLLGSSPVYEGRKAVWVGRIRVGTGVFVILFGIAFLVVGPVLA